MEYQLVLLVVTALCGSVFADHRPAYIRTCNLKSPDFKQCALDNGNYAIPFIVKGDRHLGLPPLSPLKLPLVDVTHNNFKLSLKDLEINGLENTKLKSIDMDKTKMEGVFHIENLVILGTYSMDGNVLLLTLKGEGPANITAVGGDYEIKADIKEEERDGDVYFKFINPKIEIKLERAYFNFEKLLGGNDQLSSEINQLLNDSWEDVLNDLGAPIRETISAVIESIVNKILAKIPAKDIYPEN